MLKGCLGIIVLLFALCLALKICGCIYDEAKEAAGKATAWRDERLARKAQEKELNKKKQAEAERIAEIKRQQEAAAVEAERKRQAKADKIQEFALKDAPKVWSVYQSLKSEIDVQNDKIEDLRKTLVSFGRVAEEDEDFKRICALRDEMVRSRATLQSKLEDAYIAAKKYEASPSRKDYQELHKKALEDGILEADAAEAKFKEMRLSK